MASGDHLGGLTEIMSEVLQNMSSPLVSSGVSSTVHENVAPMSCESVANTVPLQLNNNNNYNNNTNGSDMKHPNEWLTPNSPPPMLNPNVGNVNVEYLNELWQDLESLDLMPNGQNQLNAARQVVVQEIDRVWKEMNGLMGAQNGGGNYGYPPGAWMSPNGGLQYQNCPPPSVANSQTAVTLDESIPVPTDKYPNYNFIGRILGPRGMSVKQLEQDTGCRILVRGKGSVRDPRREERLLDKKGWEHLSMPLHISVSATGVDNYTTSAMLQKGVQQVRKLMCPAARDECKRRQLMELAIINGNYRPVLYESYVPRI